MRKTVLLLLVLIFSFKAFALTHKYQVIYDKYKLSKHEYTVPIYKNTIVEQFINGNNETLYATLEMLEYTTTHKYIKDSEPYKKWQSCRPKMEKLTKEAWEWIPEKTKKEMKLAADFMDAFFDKHMEEYNKKYK